MKTRLLAIALVLLAAPAVALAPEIIRNETIGLQITKPEAWYTLTAEANAANLGRVEFDDRAIEEAVARYATAPVVAFSKYEEPYDDVNPSIKINIRPQGTLQGQNAVQIMSVMLPALKKAFSDGLIQQAPTETTLSGLPAAYLRLAYTLKAGGASYPTTSELWLVPRGSHFFMVGAGSRTDEKTGSRAELRAIVESIRIRH